MVITEGLFAVDSEMADVAALQDACREHGATLLVDVAHDLGALGPGGGGTLAAQGLVGKVDLVMGSFAKTFASNGGFGVIRRPALFRRPRSSG
jgi:7-keto-8-aminopelargonate synthetase-like enzyme